MSLAEDLKRYGNQEPEQKPLKSQESEISKGIYTVNRSRPYMMKTFKEGKKKGVDPFFPSLKPHLTWKKGWKYCWTGWPKHGKSEFLNQDALAMSIGAGWRWAVWPSEAMSINEDENDPGFAKPSADEFYDGLAFAYHGKPVDKDFENHQTALEYEEALDFLHKHFIVVFPEGDHTLDCLHDHFAYLCGKLRIDGIILDPFTNLADKRTMDWEEYLKDKFLKMTRFALKHNVVYNVVAHPSGAPRRDEQGKIIAPTEHDINGKSMWRNQMEVICAVNRPMKELDPKDSSVDIHVHAVKNIRLCGYPGIATFQWARKTNRYLDNNESPIELLKKGVTPVKRQQTIDFSEPEKDQGFLNAGEQKETVAGALGDFPPF